MDIKQKTNALSYFFQRSGIPVNQESLIAFANIAQETSFPKQATILNIGEKQNYL